MNIFEIQKRFPTETEALIHLERVRWGNKLICPFCGSNRVTRMKKELRYHCNNENRSYSVRARTIFDETRLDIRKWFYSVALMLNAKKGISALQLKRDLGVSYKTAWYCLMRIRCALADDVDFLKGLVEVDTAKIGGKPKKDKFLQTINTGKGTKTSSKKSIIVAVERGKYGKVKAQLIPNTKSQTLMEFLQKNVSSPTSILLTDNAKAYHALDEKFKRFFVTHSKEFSRNGISINKAEGFFSLIKRGLIGQYHKLSVKYLPFYLAEFTYRYNHNLDKQAFENTIELAIEKKKCMIRYKCNTKKGVEVCKL